jgi:hypothetical protein
VIVVYVVVIWLVAAVLAGVGWWLWLARDARRYGPRDQR